MLSNFIFRSAAAFGGAPFRLVKCTALGSAGAGAAGGAAVGGVPGALVGGAYSTWVSGYDSAFLAAWRRNDGSASPITYAGVDDLFKCRPSMLYSIFVNQWSGTVNDDKLLIGSVNTCVAVRPFSMYGLPYSK